MPLHAVSKDPSPEDFRTPLSDLVRDFESDAPGKRMLIRDLMESDRALFYAGSIDILKSSENSAGIQCLVEPLAAGSMLLEALCDPALNKDQAIALARAALRVDPMADMSLARTLADSETGQGNARVRDAARLMEVLCEAGDPSRMMSSMLRLLRHQNSYIRSKAAKAVGRGSKSPKWVRQRLTDPDPRIRANVLETLWGVNTDEARILLQSACADGNNRVMGTALLGLYYLGENSVLADLIRMAGDESSPHRASAAWAMGEAGDGRFIEVLRRMLGDSDQIVRRRVFAALSRIKAAKRESLKAVRWDVGVRLLPRDTKETRRLLVAVAGEEACEQAKISPLGFVLSEGGAYVTSYRVTKRPAPGAINVVFVLPGLHEATGGFAESVESCLKWKRAGDFWSILSYIETGGWEPAAAGHETEPLVFTNKTDVLQRALSGPVDRSECTDLWSAMWRASAADTGPSRGRRHVIVLSSAQEASAGGRGLISRVQSGRISVQAIATGPNPRLEEFCRAAHASFHVSSQEQAGDFVRQIYLGLLGQYEISYQPAAPDAPALKVRVQGGGGWGEVIFPYPRGAE